MLAKGVSQPASQCALDAVAADSNLWFLAGMGQNPDGSITISKLGDYREFGHTLSATCEGIGCSRRTLAVTLDDLIRIFGAEWPFVEKKPTIKCSVCGSRNISWIIGGDDRDRRTTLGHSNRP